MFSCIHSGFYIEHLILFPRWRSLLFPAPRSGNGWQSRGNGCFCDSRNASRWSIAPYFPQVGLRRKKYGCYSRLLRCRNGWIQGEFLCTNLFLKFSYTTNKGCSNSVVISDFVTAQRQETQQSVQCCYCNWIFAKLISFSPHFCDSSMFIALPYHFLISCSCRTRYSLSRTEQVG